MRINVYGKKRSNWANLLRGNTLVNIVLILGGVLGAVDKGRCTRLNEFDDENPWNVHSFMGSYGVNDALSRSSPMGCFGDEWNQDITDTNFFNGFENDFEFLNECGVFESTSHQSQQQTVRDAATSRSDSDEEQHPTHNALEEVGRESEILRTPVTVAGAFPTPDEQKIPKRSLARDETVVWMEKARSREASEIKAKNTTESKMCEQGKERGQLQGAIQKIDLRSDLPQMVSSVHVSSYLTATPISLALRSSLRDQRGVLTGSTTVEMSQQQAVCYINDCLALQRDTLHSRGGGIGFTISHGKISAIRTYAHEASLVRR